MRVLHLIPSFGSGGAERQLSLISPELTNVGVECHIGYCHGGPNLAGVQNGNVHLHRLNGRGNHDPRIFIQILKLIRKIKPDLVQTWLLQMDVMGGTAALIAGVPFVLSERSSASAYPNGLKTFVRSRIGRKASQIVANSQGGLDYWATRCGSAPLCLIRNCIVLKDFSGLNILDFPLGGPLVLFGGRLCEDKNVRLLLDALIQVIKAVPKCIVYMFGEGPLKDGLQRKIVDSNMSGKIFLGGYTHNLDSWISRADVCVSISNFEGNPNFVIEAASLGRPLVLSNIPAHREIFDGSSASFVNHKSVGDVRDAIVRSLVEKELSSKRAQSAKLAVARYTVDVTVSEYLKVYSRVVKSRKLCE